jgi:hypothetical protein
MFRDYGMENCNGITTPIKISSRLVPTEPVYLAEVVFRQKYQSIIGFLIYTILDIWPDLVFVISVISRFSANPTIVYMVMVKQMFKYLKETLYIGFIFYRSLQSFTRYNDNNWVGDPAICQLTSEYIFNLGFITISWFSKRQSIIFFFFYKAEYIGMTNTIKKII